jgi:hypothetical protein
LSTDLTCTNGRNRFNVQDPEVLSPMLSENGVTISEQRQQFGH